MESITDAFNSGDILLISLVIIACLIVVVAIFSLGVCIYLAIAYIKFNHVKNSAGLTGEEAARKILDDNGLEHIKVSIIGSLLFGNSYSHYFKKVRLRRFTRTKRSISSLAMGAQKSALAILDKEGDKDMKTRVKLVPLITFGPFMFIPLLIIGVLIDIFVFNFTGVVSIIFAGLGFLFYVLALVLSIMMLKTEKKAQTKALEILEQKGMATEEERKMIKDLFRLYNIEYINNIILSILELLYRILSFFARIKYNSNSNSNSKS